MVRGYKLAVLLIAIVCLVSGNAHSADNSTAKVAAPDGADYVYVSLNSDTQLYKVMPKEGEQWKVAPSDVKDMSSYNILSKENNEKLLSYYRSIREKILGKLKRNYASHYNDGDVHLFFILDNKGAIKRIDVALNRSTKDNKLIDTALLSLQQASPFGPFPKELSVPQMPFSLIITFKKDN